MHITDILILTGIVFALGLIFFVPKRIMSRKLKSLFEKTDPSASVRCQCMIHETGFEAPGVAQVLGGDLWIFTLLGDTMRIPLAQTHLTKISHDSYGRYPWWGKTRFYLDTPKTNGLVIGVDDYQAWETVLKVPEIVSAKGVAN